MSIPALRERREDIPQLVTHFVRKFAKKQGKTIESISDRVQTALLEYKWPGNIRELENVVERAVILSTQGKLHIDGGMTAQSSETRGTDNAAVQKKDRRTLAQIEREHIVSVLNITGWRIAGKHGAAVILGLHLNTLRSRMNKLKITKSAHGPGVRRRV